MIELDISGWGKCFILDKFLIGDSCLHVELGRPLVEFANMHAEFVAFKGFQMFQVWWLFLSEMKFPNNVLLSLCYFIFAIFILVKILFWITGFYFISLKKLFLLPTYF